MRFGWWLVGVAVGLGFVACSGNGPVATGGRPGGSAGTGGSVAEGGTGGSGGSGGMGGIGGDVGCGDDLQGGVPAAFGMDARPPNTTCVAPPRPSTGAPVKLVPAFGGLRFDQPLGLVQAPGNERRWYVLERPGRILTFEDGDARATVALDLGDEVASGPDEAGLLGLAFPPGFPGDPRAFVYYTSGDGGFRAVLSSFGVSRDGRKFDAGSEVKLLELDRDRDFHNGGQLQFGPDGYLYVALGDGGNGKDARKLDVLFGKVLRLDVSGPAYAIPPDNPYAGGGGRGEIWASGFRNPWRFSFDRDTGELWLGDVGKSDREEVNRVLPGLDYGWDSLEGTFCREGPCDAASAPPVLEYDHGEGKCIAGGYVYRGDAIPALQGAYVFADFIAGRIWGLFPGEDAPRLLMETSINPASFGESLGGEIFVADHTGGTIYALVADGNPQDGFPRRLSETGCMDPADPAKPGPALIPYAVNAPLWSDGADKERWMAIPDGAQIAVGDDGDWEFPVGTVLVKTFRFDCKPIETRLFVRHEDGGWAGYTYEWNDAGTDATLLATGKTVKRADGGTWTFPSRGDCMSCHTAAAGRALGPETAQLNREIRWPNGKRANIVDTLSHVGLFAEPPGSALRLPGLPDPFGDAPLAARARSYLHANCSSCHRPGGSGQGELDLRYDAEDANVCEAEPQEGDLGIAGALLLAPGDPAHSLVSVRMQSLGRGRMPPIGTAVVDEKGAALIDEWIRSIATCE